MSAVKYGIHWFRRDLRIAGNSALQANWKKHEGRVLGVFCFDAQFLARADFSHNRFAFFLRTLEELRKDLRAIGGDLLVLDGAPQKIFPEILSKVKIQPSLVTWNRDYEPYARERDEQMLEVFREQGVNTQTERDHLILEPQEVLKDDGGFYQVYSPFAKRWFEKFCSSEVQSRVSSKKTGLHFYKGENKDLFKMQWKEVLSGFDDQLEKFRYENDKQVTVPIPEGGARAGLARLKKFSKSLKEYKTQRDFPAVDGTSQLSIYFKNGSLTTSQVIASLNLGREGFASESGANRYLKELVWREFYYSILWNAPRVENEAFLEKFKKLKWSQNKKHFERWCEGTTGYPIVDAGMRQLNTTGWMHNRVRMIVASFLTKDLLIDWRWGEKYFMNKLLDGDLAPNNGGWQWAASTGCDPQPYFRIFNPYLQSKKFDPDGEYIRTYVKELRGVKGRAIHRPEDVVGYPEPMVDHSVQRHRALELYDTK